MQSPVSWSWVFKLKPFPKDACPSCIENIQERRFGAQSHPIPCCSPCLPLHPLGSCGCWRFPQASGTFIPCPGSGVSHSSCYGTCSIAGEITLSRVFVIDMSPAVMLAPVCSLDSQESLLGLLPSLCSLRVISRSCFIQPLYSLRTMCALVLMLFWNLSIRTCRKMLTFRR